VAECDLLRPKPVASLSWDHQEPIKEKNFRVHVFIREYARCRADRNLDVAVDDLPLQRKEIGLYDVERESWMLAAEPFDGRRHNDGCQRRGASDSYLPDRRIKQRLDIVYALS